MTFVIYHNPECGTSRNTLALLRSVGVEARVVEYLKTPPSRAELAALVSRMGLAVRDVIRQKGTPYAALGLDDPALGDDALLDAMIAHPILINRPIVVGPAGVRLCRPSDIVFDLLPSGVTTALLKEEGVPFLVDERVPGDAPGFVGALQAAALPIDDLAEPGRTFFAYRTAAGDLVGFGGYEALGRNALLRSIVVLPAWRAQALGRNLVALLQRRAFDEGAREAWVLTGAAAPFFETIGFKPTARGEAPASILATRQATRLCPADARLLTRTIQF
ncbi:arsenate reductase (glutaredoxin) [Kaistia defluvii]|uniref:arsenate reductase (glutaredoxin) n=1 Tax=Kaistia defluvii TaxID=410841 RepID=UPI00225625D0|nr:arsenate reductase (glutaredoxin) [Kaistia defluvii]MCX5520878.1 arsenate reductase (glutaredoxin) [Kaistia defluvii]